MEMTISGKYKYVVFNSKFMTEHRKIMHENDPKPNEDELVIHHIDGNKSNNDPNNLMWMTPSEHARFHHLGENHYPCDGENNPNYRHGQCVGGPSKEYKKKYNKLGYEKNREARIEAQRQYQIENRDHINWYHQLRNWKIKLEQATDQERIDECLVKIKELEDNPL